VDFVAKVETPSSTIMMPSPVSIATTDVIDARKHSMKHALRSGFYDSEWQVDDAMDVLSGKAEEVTNLRQHPPTQRKASGRHESEFMCPLFRYDEPTLLTVLLPSSRGISTIKSPQNFR